MSARFATEDHSALAQAARTFCEDVLGPSARADDEAERFRVEHIRALGEQGFCGIPTPEASGGLGLGSLEYCLGLEEIARVSASYAVGVAVSGLLQVILDAMGTPQQREQWLPGLAAGELIGGFALSESGSGSDAAALRSKAERDGGDYVLNG